MHLGVIPSRSEFADLDNYNFSLLLMNHTIRFQYRLQIFTIAILITHSMTNYTLIH